MSTQIVKDIRADTISAQDVSSTGVTVVPIVDSLAADAPIGSLAILSSDGSLNYKNASGWQKLANDV